MKKFFTILVILLFFAATISVSATPEEDAFYELVDTLVGTMEDDFAMLLNGLGSDLDPVLLQNALVGQNVGMAELGSKHFDNFYFSILPTVSFSVANGMFKYTDTQAYNDTLVLKSMLDNLLFGADGALGELTSNPDYGELVDVLLNKATPIPALKLNAGAKLPVNLELLVHGMWVPNAISGVIPESVMSEMPGGMMPEFSYLNIGAQVRYVLLRDSKQTPGMSIGVGGVYNNLKLGLGLGSLLGDVMGDMLDSKPASITEDPFANAGMSLGSSVIGFGIDTSISKKLAIFYPFVKLGAWYGITDFSGEVILIDADNDEDDVIINDGAGHNDMDLLLSTGFDMMLGPFGSNLTVDYNLGTGVWGLNLGSRLQF